MSYHSKSKHLTQFALLLIALVLTMGIVQAQDETEEVEFIWTSGEDATIATDWMMLLYEIIRDETVDAPSAARLYGYAGVTLYESVVAGMWDNFSVGGQLQDLPMLPYPDWEKVVDWQSSANGAMATLLVGFFPESEDALERIAELKAEWITARTEVWGEEIVAYSTTYGEEIGGVILEWSITDNSGPVSEREFVPPTGDPSYWVETASGQAPIGPYWGEVRPFGMGFPEQCNVLPRMEFSDSPDSTFYKQALEVMQTGDRLTDEQRTIARFWLDTPGVTGAPAGHWVMIETQLVEQMGLDLARSAEMYMLVNAALADGFISAWNLKYQVNLLRPVTYIQRHIRRNWSPYIQTPPFPEYPSGHSVVSAAAAEVLTTMFGQVAFDDRTPIINGHENLQRSFTSFESAANEAAISRLYGGIHFRAAIENGMRQGRCVGQSVINNIRLRSVPQGE